ncbi:MAG: ATP-dependent DNA helicase RecG [Pseudomonadota bacterium]
MRDDRLNPLFEPLDALPGVGPKIMASLSRLVGGDKVWDLLLHLPVRWMDRRLRDTFDDAIPGEVCTVRGTVQSHAAPHSATAPHRIRLADDSGFLTLVFFRADGRWLNGQFPINAERIVSGRVEDFNGERQIVHPDYIVDPGKRAAPPPVEPIYSLSAGLTNKRVHSAAVAALDHIPDSLPEWIDGPLLAKKTWPSFQRALSTLHAPAAYDPVAFELSVERLAYDEALARELTFAAARQSRSKRIGPAMPRSNERLAQLISSLPYSPTGAQVRAYDDIASDLSATTPMRRMLQGDVGSGKTLVGAMAAVQAAANGFQTAFMAPTEVLARQQFNTLVSLLTPLGYTIEALTGRDKGSAREALLMGLTDGTIQVIAGTQALFQQNVSFRNLGLVIVDEQHRFGVLDRARLADKAVSPHMLVMSATPIPRTLALAVNGDLDVSILDEKPVGRQPIETRALPDTRIEDVVGAVNRAVANGERAYWICPKVDVDDDESTAVGRHAALRDQLSVPVGLVHGRLKPQEKDAALEAFRRGDTSVLVATTVVEVGVDVPEATIMVIERAEGFGLAQLHQLRGRVGRGSAKSFCLLLYRPPLTESAEIRLKTLRDTDDGFEIAEADYKLRGPGDLLGLRQSGAPELRILNLADHAGLFGPARQDARLLMDKDPELSSGRGKAVTLLRALLDPRVPTVRPE